MGYPVIKRSKYKSASQILSQPVIPSNQYPNKFNLDNTKVWHTSDVRSNGLKEVQLKTIQDTSICSKKTIIQPIDASNNNDQITLNSDINKTIWVNWKKNYYYPLISDNLEEEIDENLDNERIFGAIKHDLYTIFELQEENMSAESIPTAMEEDGKPSATTAEVKPSDTKTTGMITRSKTMMKQKIDNFVSVTKKLTTTKPIATSNGSASKSTTLSHNQGSEYDTSLEVSTKYIPRKMPKFTSIVTYAKEDEEDDIEDIVEQDLSMVIRIDRRKNKHLNIDNRRLFVAVSKALQYFAPELKVALRNCEEDLENIDDTPTDDQKLLEHFMENPTTSKNYVYTVKYHYRTFVPFHRIMYKNEELKRWLKSEGISLELNNIKATNLVNVGFYIKCHPRVSIMDSQIARITSLLPDNIPEFMPSTSQVWSHGNYCTVIMIKSCVDDVKELSSLLKTEKEVDSYRFIEWGHWDILSGEFKNAIIQTQQEYLNKYASVILKGFVDNDDVSINFGSIKEVPEDWTALGDMNITDFLCNYYATAAGEPLIEGCYPPSLGVRELLVLRSRSRQCIEWAKIVKGEIWRMVSDEAKVRMFKHPEKVAKESTKEWWVGNSLEIEFAPVHLSPNNKRSYKKYKHNTEKNSRSYSQVLQNNNNATINNASNNNTASSMVINHQSAVISEIQTQIKDLNIKNREYSLKLNYIESSVTNNNKEIKTLKTDVNESIAKLAADTTVKISEVHSLALTTNILVTTLSQQTAEIQKMMLLQGQNMQAIFDRSYPNPLAGKENPPYISNSGGNQNACNGQGTPLGSVSFN